MGNRTVPERQSEIIANCAGEVEFSHENEIAQPFI